MQHTWRTTTDYWTRLLLLPLLECIQVPPPPTSRQIRSLFRSTPACLQAEVETGNTRHSGQFSFDTEYKGPCISMLQHKVMVVDEWHNNGPQDLVMVSLCIQNAINKMHLCSLSITYTCPNQNPTTTMGHSIHNIDVCKPYAMYANRLLQQLSGWLVSDDLGGEDAECGGPGLVWLHGICVCEAGWMYCQILSNAFGDGLW